MKDVKARLAADIVMVHSPDTVPDLGLAGGTWLEHDGMRHVMQIDTTMLATGTVLAALLARISCSDVTVEDPPMEDIVRQIYATQRAA